MNLNIEQDHSASYRIRSGLSELDSELRRNRTHASPENDTCVAGKRHMCYRKTIYVLPETFLLPGFPIKILKCVPLFDSTYVACTAAMSSNY